MSEDLQGLVEPGGEEFLPQWSRVMTFALAARITPLVAFSANQADPEMLKPASNTIGAHLRCAYWLSVSLRVAYYQRNVALQSGNVSALLGTRITRIEDAVLAHLIQSANGAFINGQYYFSGWLSEVFLRVIGDADTTLRSAKRADIRRIYTLGIQRAVKVESPAARKQLQRLAAMKPPVDRSGLPGFDSDGDGKADIPFWVWLAGGVLIIGGIAVVANPSVKLIDTLAKR